MSAFTEEQQAILREAFNHVWSRMAGLQDNLNDDSLRVSGALAVLAARGLLTDEEIDEVMVRFHVEAAGHEAQQEPERMTEPEITAAILGGDLEAFHRQRPEEEA